MNSLQRLWMLIAVLCGLQTPAMRAQVVQVSVGSSSTADTQGGGVAVYSAGAISRLSVGSAAGLHVGFSREIQTEATRVVVGDTALPLTLITDGPQDQRPAYGRGLLVQTRTGARTADLFVGRSGEQRGNSLFSAVLPDKPILTMNLTDHVGDFTLQTFFTRGDATAMLMSIQRSMGLRARVAVTAGMANGKPIVRGRLHADGSSWSLEASDTSGDLQLQPEPQLQQFTAEQIGWNAAVTKQFGRLLILDGARHESATHSQDLQRATVLSGARSVLLEGGAALHLGNLHTGLRALASHTGSSQDSGLAWITGWRRPQWDLQTTILHRGTQNAANSTTLEVESGKHLDRYFRVEGGLQLGTGAPTFDVGGVVEGNFGSVRVSHGETYVPYGPTTGFRRVLSVAVQLHVKNAVMRLTRISATGIHSEYDGSMTDYEGSDLGSGPASYNSSAARMAKYRVQGVVQGDDNVPVEGAAVALGDQTVYTDSEGRWMARFTRASEVRVSVQPDSFLTPENYRAVSEASMVLPEVQPRMLQLRVAKCRSAVVRADPLPAPAATSAQVTTFKPGRYHAIKSVLSKLVRFWVR